MLRIKCAICGKKQRIKRLFKANFDIRKISEKTFSARRTPDKMHYQFVVCNNCGLIFSNPIFPIKKITSLYGKSDFDYSVESKYAKKVYGKYLKKILPGNPMKTTLLDIGCANGFFLEEAKTLGVKHVFGIEPGKKSVQKASKDVRKNISIGLFTNRSFKKNSFDIITCFHTLDHVISPNSFLKAAYESLKKGGKALFITHDTQGLSVKLFNEKSPIFDIEHIYLFNKSTLQKIFKKNKFKNISVFPVYNTYPLSYWARLLPIPIKMKKTILSILTKTSLAVLPFTIPAGNIGIIAEK